MTVVRHRTAVVAAFAAVVLASAASRSLAAQGRPELAGRLQPATRVAIEQLVDSLATESLPTMPLYDKAAEGALKGADDSRILAAVRGLAQRLRDARRLLGQSATEAELSGAASALHVGAQPALIRALVTARDERVRGRSLGLPLVVLANLIADGVPASSAGESLTALLVRGARDDELSEFRFSVARDIEDGKSPDAAAARITKRFVQKIDDRARQP